MASTSIDQSKISTSMAKLYLSKALSERIRESPLSGVTATITEGKHFPVTSDHVSQQHGDGRPNWSFDEFDEGSLSA